MATLLNGQFPIEIIFKADSTLSEHDVRFVRQHEHPNEVGEVEYFATLDPNDHGWVNPWRVSLEDLDGYNTEESVEFVYHHPDLIVGGGL